MASEFVIKNGYFSQGNSNITGSLTVTGGVTASLQGTASYAITAATASFLPASGTYNITSSWANNSITASYYAETDPVFNSKSGSFTTTSSFNSFTSSYTTGSFTGSFNGSGTGLTGVISSSYALSSSYAVTASYSKNLQISGSINNVDYIDFNESAGVTVQSGQLAWNSSDGTLDLGLKGGNVTLQLGQETLYEVRNATGVTISNGTSLYASGVTSGSGRIEASPFTSDGSVRDINFLGLATEDIGIGVNGFVTHFGYTRDLDTRGTAPSSIAVGDENWSVGDILYAHPTVAGKLTNVKPKHEISVAIIINRHQTTGVLFVRPTSFGHLFDNHDVNINTGSLSTGDLLIYDSGSDYWTNSRQLTGSYGLTGSLNVAGQVIGSFTGSLFGTASYASYVEYTNVANKPTLISSSAQIATDISGAFASTSASLDAKINNVVATTVTTASFNSFTGSYTTASFTGSFTGNGSGLIGVVTSSYAISSSYALNALTSSYSLNSQLLNGSDSAVFATTGSNIFKASQTITGSLTITNDLVVLGSSSIQYITSSQLDISTNIISVNTFNPSLRFGGLSVIDSGSSPQTSGSLLFDSQNNQWIFVHQDGGAATTSSVLIMGPQTFNDIGNEGTITTNRLTKGTGGDLGEHIGDSNITDTGTVVSINSNTEITGSLNVGTFNISSGISSYAQGYGNTATGSTSTALGQLTVASGYAAMSNGASTLASGYASHAEGNFTTASGNNSHAEGGHTIANAGASHAEGGYTLTVLGAGYSHAEGYYTTASGIYSHAEGYGTVAIGAGSHTEGEGTIASGSAQHASGKYNKQDDSTSLFIIGNGTSDVARSDIFRVTNTNVQVSGSLLVSGSLTVGGTIIGNGGMSMSGSNSVTGSLIITGSTSVDLVRITQTGTGNAFVVEDSSNPDSSQFVIDSSGRVGIGTQYGSIYGHFSVDTTVIGGISAIYGTSNSIGVYAYAPTAVKGESTILGLHGKVENDTVATGTGVWGQATYTGESTPPLINIGGKFQADSATSNYSVQLIDGTETTAGRFLINQTTDGKANWGKTIPDIQITGAITGSTGNNTSTDTMIQSALLYLSNNC